MHARTRIFRGTIHSANGDKQSLRFRKTKLYFVDELNRKWIADTGYPMGKELDGYRLDVMSLVADGPRGYLRALPYKGRVRALFAHGNEAKHVLLRDTKLFYIDSTGRKYRKTDGWSPDEQVRLLLETVEKVVIV